MPVLAREQIPPPNLPKETIAVESLGGEVVVRGLRLTERLAMQQRIADLHGGEAGAALRVMVPELLAVAVIDAAGQALFTAAQWEDFGATQQGEALRLFNAAMRLSGFADDADRKN